MSDAATAQERPRHCVHYSGRDLLLQSGRKICRAGVDILALIGGDEFGWFKRCPCSEGNNGAPACEKRELPSWEQVRADRAELNRRVEQVVATAKQIPKTGSGGTIDCPRCQGPLDWSRSPHNGHVHGRCRTEGCLSWME